jgi:NAD(P)-dependent dehydrogenase (short-subunit alcohol dehydrogenase family)
MTVEKGRVVAVVTGGASGFGRALGEALAARGMQVALLDIDGARAEEEAAALSKAHGVDALGMAVDVAQADDVAAAAAKVSERFGQADVVVSNVGVQLFGALERLTDEEWRWVLDVNVIGAARTARAFLPLLRKAPAGRLAFTTSSSVLSPASRMAAYQASKFALWGLAETLRLELAGEPVTVSVIFPSGMLSRHLETSSAAQPEHVRREIGGPDDFEAMFASNPDMTRDLATPEEAAGNVVDAVLAGERYVITHGDLVDAVVTRDLELRRAAEVARGPGERAPR